MANLATKYRPQTFTDVVEQSISVKILEQAVATKSFKNAYLFAGLTGSGKTTCARIFAKEINKGIGDPIEMDCASVGNVDTIRSIIESANQRNLVGEYKIFILDEAQAITTQGWQAFLKGIEETPKFTIFIFCTTEPNKIPAPVLNRLQRYNFTAISSTAIKNRLMYICKAEGYTNYENTCELISKAAHGSMRDAITYLEQCADYSTDLKIENTKQVLGDLSYETMFKLTWAVNKKDIGSILTILDTLKSTGTNLKVFVNNYLEFLLDLSKYIIFKDITLTSIPAYLATTDNAVVQYTVNIDNALSCFEKLVSLLLTIKSEIKYDTDYANTISAYFVKFCSEV